MIFSLEIHIKSFHLEPRLQCAIIPVVPIVPLDYEGERDPSSKILITSILPQTGK